MLCCTIAATATVKIGGVTITSGTTLTSSSSAVAYGTVKLSGSILTLTNATIYAENGNAGIFTDQNLQIKLVGWTTIVGDEVSLNFTNATVTISSDDGKGKLEAINQKSAALRNEGSTIYIKQCEVDFVGKEYTVWTQNTTLTEVIDVTNAIVRFKNTGGTTPTLSRLAKLNLTGCSLCDGYVFSGTGVKTSSSGSYVTGMIKIEPDTYPVKVKGIQVNTLNQNDVLGDGGSVHFVLGSVYLNNANIEYDDVCIKYEDNTITRPGVHLKGTNTITCTGNNCSAIWAKGDFFIENYNNVSSGTLTINSTGSGAIGVKCGGNLYFYDKSTTINAPNPIVGTSGSSKKLTFQNTYLTATKTETNGTVVCGFPSIYYYDCSIISPTYLTFSDTNYRYWQGNNAISQLKVAPGSNENISPTILKLECTDKTFSTATLCWEAADNMTNPKNMQYAYTLSKGSSIVKSKTALTTGIQNTTLTDLSYNAQYTFTLEAKDEKGNVNYKEVTFTTPTPAKYQLSVCGIEVNELNCNDILGDGGKVSYDPEMSILTLDNVNVDAGYDNFIDATTFLTVKIIGNNTISTSNDLLNSGCDVTFVGSTTDYKNNTLTCDGGLVQCRDMTIKDCSLSTSAILGSHYDYGTNIAKLIVSNSHIYNTSFYEFADVTLSSNVYIDEEKEYTYDTNKQKFTTADGKATSSPTIRPKWFTVDGIQVARYNAKNVKSGVSYDTSSNTLKLCNATLSNINCKEDLNIELDGYNVISQATNKNLYGVNSEGSNLTISGNGNLTMSGFMYSLHSRGNISITNSTLNLTASSYAIHAVGKLSFNAAALNASKTTTTGSCVYFNGLSLTESLIKTPNGMTASNYTSYASQLNTFVVVKNRTFTIEVEGYYFTDQEIDDVIHDGGTVRYNPDTNTLTLDNTSIYNSNGYGIYQHSGDLNIVLIGENSVKGSICALRSAGALKISGDDSSDWTSNILELTKTSGNFAVICDNDFDVENCTLTAGNIHSTSDRNYPMKVTNAYVESYINGFSEVKLNNSYFKNDCHYDSDMGCTVDNNSGERKDAIISPVLLVVDGIKVTPANCTDILGNQTASYDFSTSTLTLDNATIGNEGIYMNANLTIKLEGENYIMGTNYQNASTAIYQYNGDLTIVGPGSLTIQNFDIGIARWNNNPYGTTIKKCNCYIFTHSYGIVNNVGTLVFNNANVALNSEYPLISKWLAFTNCAGVTHTNDYLKTNCYWGELHDEVIRISANTLIGDVNNDGRVSLADLTSLINTLKSSGIIRYYDAKDVNCDGKITILDVRALERKLLNK